jgi:hypothetical protein
LTGVGWKNGQIRKAFFLLDFSAILVDSKFDEKTQTKEDLACERKGTRKKGARPRFL